MMILRIETNVQTLRDLNDEPEWKIELVETIKDSIPECYWDAND